MSTQEWITFNDDVTDRFENAAWKCDGAWGTGQDAWNAMWVLGGWWRTTCPRYEPLSLADLGLHWTGANLRLGSKTWSTT